MLRNLENIPDQASGLRKLRKQEQGENIKVVNTVTDRGGIKRMPDQAEKLRQLAKAEKE